VESTSCLPVKVLVRRVLRQDYPEIRSWFKARGVLPPADWAFSTIGFMVPGVAAGFLYLTNSGVAEIDCYISNPAAEHRKFALQAITEKIMVTAVQLGVKMLCCNSKLGSIEALALDNRFTSIGNHKHFAKSLINIETIGKG
jgi:hypothetical protein